MRSLFKRLKADHLSPIQETLLVWAGLAIAVFFFYREILLGYFLVDDFNYLLHLVDHAPLYSQGQELGRWFLDFNGNSFLRPMVQWLWLAEFIAWSRDATGYYLTNIFLHWLNAGLIYVLVRRISGSRFGAVSASLLFALHPIHADSVAWVSDLVDLLAAFFCLLGSVFFVLFRQRSRVLYFLVCIISILAAGLTKESALTLPLILVVYDVLFNFPRLGWSMLKAQLVLVLCMPGYLALRLFLFHGFGGYPQIGYLSFGWELFLQYNVMALAQPFVADMNRTLLIVVLALCVPLLLVCRQRKEMWFGLAWLILAFIPAGAAAYIAPRLVYIPSIGLAIAEGALLARLLPRESSLSKGLRVAFLVVIATAYGSGLAGRVDAWAAAGRVTASIERDTLRLYSSFPLNSKVYFAGIPSLVRGLEVYGGNFPLAIGVMYHKTPLFTLSYTDKFPVVTNGLDQSRFLEYRRQTVVERQDVRETLIDRLNCLGFSSPKIEWDFANDAQGWEPWNDLAGFETRDGGLATKSLGNDPYMASPPMDVAAAEIGDIEITVRVQSQAPDMHGAVYWRASGSQDFSPFLTESFLVKPDGEFHSYRVDIARTGKLFLGDRIEQLRLDPVDGPADIEFKAIRVYTHCTELQGDLCRCK